MERWVCVVDRCHWTIGRMSTGLLWRLLTGVLTSASYVVTGGF